jgi:flagellar hook capping protein FlgD
MKHALASAVLTMLVVSRAAAGVTAPIESVSVSRTYINPSLGDSIELTVNVLRPGAVTAQLVDRDGFLVRTITESTKVAAGLSRWRWDGRDALGRVVPDEAYSFRVEWTDGADRAIYFPADRAAAMTSVDPDYYAERTATIAYTLPAPSRVHLQTGVATKNPKTGEMDGPVMKTVVNREPRAAGRVAEPWNGFDESGLVRVSDLPDFVVAIATTPLPENSVITYGNRSNTFGEAALTRKGSSLFTTTASSHAHHAGLSVLEDVSPAMRLEPVNAVWSKDERLWVLTGRTLRVRVSLSGPSSAVFARQPGEIYRFADGRLLSKSARPAALPAEIEIKLPRTSRTQNMSVNWRSEFGAVAANTLQVRLAPRQKSAAAGVAR